MKHKLLNKLLFLLLCTLGGASFNPVWADTKTLVYSVTTKTSVTLQNASTGSFSGTVTFVNTDSNNNDQMTQGSTMTLTLSSFPYKVTKVSLNLKKNSSKGGGTVSIKHNNNEIGSGTKNKGDLTSSYTNYDFSCTDSYTTGDMVVLLTSSENSFWCNKFTITYEETSPTTCATPTFSPAAGAVPSGTSVTISSTAGATIYYTTDGSDPTTGSSVYSSAITIDAAKTIKAFAVKSGLTDSGIATAAYTIAKVATPTFSPAAGEVDKDSEITISCATDGATIYYTTDGSTPTASSTAYNPASKPTIDDDKTIKAIAIKANYIDSDVSSASYTYARVKSYNLVTSVSQIVSGKHYLIANAKEGSVVVMDAQNSNNRGQKTATFSGSTLQAKSAREFIIQGPDKNGWYAIYDAVEDGYLYAANSSSNYLKTGAYTSDSPFSITIDVTSYEANIVGKGSYTRNIMRYNSSSNIFSCYGSGQNPIYLFELDGEETPTESVTVGDRGYITYTTLNAVSIPSGLKSYFVTATGADQVTLTETGASVPARTPLVIEAAAGEYELTSVVSPASAEGNLLNEALKTTTGDGSTIYALGVGKTGVNEGKVGFYLVKSGVKVPAGKAYLKITGGGAKEFFTFDFGDEPDGIETVDNRQQTTDNSPIYNLAGQRISKMQKGINIINGKKVLK